jgi:hypothetical protein
MDEPTIKSLHVLMDPDEFAAVERMRGNRKWKEWLLGLPDQFRELTERVELWKHKSEVYEMENAQLKQRITSLQEKVGDA